MHSKAVFLALFSGFIAAGFSQAQTKAPAADSFKNEAIVFERSETTWKMHADGTGERDIHVTLRVQSDGAAQQFGVLSFSFASAYETPQIKLVRVHKADGSTVDTPPAEAIDMPAAVSREAPLYSDLKEKHLPVRSLSKGDKLEYEVDTAIDKAEAPGQFWGAMHFTPPGTIVVLDEILTLEVPSEKYVQVWSPNHKPTVTDANGIKTYSWDVPQLVTAPRGAADDDAKPAGPKDPDEDADGRKLPSVGWTTFHSWAEVGDWYRSLALVQANPGDALKARADDLTRDAKTPEEQMQALYNFVSARTRYVGIDFGIGRYQPHSAAEVLANQYGDCKDKDTLLESLLRAKGFSTSPALVGAGIAPTPDLPSPAVFNHVITTVNLPGGRIWLDSTPLAAPYRYLSQTIREQKALVVPAEGPAALVSTPADGPYPFTARFEAVGALDTEGKITAKITATYRDDDEPPVRALARSIAPADWDKVSQYLSANSGFGGATSNTHFNNSDDASNPIQLTYDYARHPYGDWDNLRIVPLFPAIELAPLSSDSAAPEEDIQLGAPRSLKAVSRIRVPEGYRPDLPDPIHIKTDFATFDKSYRFEGNEIVAEREFAILKAKLPKTDWKRYQSFTKDISLNSEAWIQLIRPSKTAVTSNPPSVPIKTIDPKTGKESQTITVNVELPEGTKPEKPVPPSPAPSPDASVAELMSNVQEKIRSMDWSGAKEILDQVKAKNPNEKGLWAEYAVLAEVQDRNYEEAKTDFRKELAAQPDNPMVIGALADAQVKSNDSIGARQTVQKFLTQHPENLQLSIYLASLQTKANDYEGTLKTLEAAAEQHPDNRGLRTQVADTLIHLHRNEEAAAAAKSALDGEDDAGMLNNAAYVLSETGTSLDVAEEVSRKSIDKLEEESVSITTAAANSRAFARANLLIASWDTLGWILFREGKLNDAQPLLSAAWRAGLRAEIGDHLGQLYEAMGKKEEALSAYKLAQAAISGSIPQDLRDHILDGIQRLNGGAKLGPAISPQALQDLRTYHIPRPKDANGWGTFRLEVTTAGVIESQQISGEQHLAAIKPAIDAMKFPELLPPASKAHLLRSAVVSCSMGKTCDVVLVPDGGLQTERE